MSHDIAYMWNLKKNGTNEPIYKTEVESQMQKTNLWLPRGKEGTKETISELEERTTEITQPVQHKENK